MLKYIILHGGPYITIKWHGMAFLMFYILGLLISVCFQYLLCLSIDEVNLSS